VRLSPLAPFGAETADTEPDAPVDSAALHAGLARHGVIVLRNMPIDDAGFVALLCALGTLAFTAGETPVPGHPDLNIVTNAGRTTPPRSVFHTDTSYVAAPPAYTALRPVLLPRGGGATLFSDQVRAAATLPARWHDALIGRTACHAAMHADGTRTAARHPLLCRHPRSDAVTLYLSTPERVTDIDGAADAAASARTIAALYRHSIRAARLYPHEWRTGDVLIWDNRLTMHRADHSAVDGTRTLHRGLVAGTVPIPA